MAHRYVILGREKPSEPWALICICDNREKAAFSASLTEEQERNVLGHKRFKAVLVTEADYYTGKIPFQKKSKGKDGKGQNEKSRAKGELAT
jgi:hypothetical protein